MSSLYCQLKVKAFGMDDPSNDAKATYWKKFATLLHVLVKELHAAHMVVENAYNYPEWANTLYL